MIITLKPIRSIRWSRVVRRFIKEQEELGNILSQQTTPDLLASVRTLVVDVPMIMEGWNAVRMAAAPIALRSIEQFKRQGSWMMLTAGVALGCDGYAPLESFAREMNFESSRMAKQYPKVESIPYDNRRRMETTIHRDANGLRAFAKGDPAAILACCSFVLDGQEREIFPMDRESVQSAVLKMESYGLETLGFATKWLENTAECETDMVFLGVVGMGDLAKEDIPATMDAFREMDIRPVLVTEETVLEGAARASGILRSSARILNGPEIEEMDDDALANAASRVDAFVGVAGFQRNRVIRALRSVGELMILSEASDGKIGLSLRRDCADAPDTALLREGIEEVLRLFQTSQALYREHRMDFERE